MCRRGRAARPVLLAAAACLMVGPAGCAQQKPRLELFVAQNKAYALYKPAAWMVSEEPGKEDLRILAGSPD